MILAREDREPPVNSPLRLVSEYSVGTSPSLDVMVRVHAQLGDLLGVEETACDHEDAPRRSLLGDR